MGWRPFDPLGGNGGGGDGIPRSEIPESTGLKLGGFISQGAGDTIDYTAYSGVIVDATTYPNIDTTVFGDAGTYNVNTSVDGTFLLAVDATNTFIQIDVNAFGTDERRDNVNFGAFTVSGGALVSVTPARQDSNEVYQQLLDLLGCLGTIRCDGLNASPSGLLGFDVASGVVMSIGAGATNGERPQNTLSVNAAPNASFRTLLGTVNTVNPVSQTSIDPANYDDGSGSAVAIGGSGARSTIQYIYLIPTGPDASIYVMYGQTIYSTLQDALDAGIEDKIELPSLYAKSALLLGRVALRNDATDLEDPLQARFLAGARFGSGLVGGSAASGAGGGDMFGAASAQDSEVFTSSGVSGKVAKADSDVRITNGAIERITNNANLTLSQNGTGKINIADFEFDLNSLSAPSGNGEIYLGNPTVQGPLTQAESDDRSHVGGEVFYNTDEQRLQQYVNAGSFAVHNVGTGDGNVVSNDVPIATNTVVTYTDSTSSKVGTDSALLVNDATIDRVGAGVLKLRVNATQTLEFNQFNDDLDIDLTAPNAKRIGFNFKVNGVTVGGMGVNSTGVMKLVSDTFFSGVAGVNVMPNGWVGIGDEFSTQEQIDSVALGVFSEDRGFLPPQMTQAQRDAITTPVNGLIIDNTDTNSIERFDGSDWHGLSEASRGGNLETINNATATTLNLVNSYAMVNLGGSSTAVNLNGFEKNGSRMRNNSGSTFDGNCTIIGELRTAASTTTKTYDLRVHVMQSAVGMYITLQDVPQGARVPFSISLPVSIPNSENVELRIKQVGGSLDDNPIIAMHNMRLDEA